jgi:hypothetical protein
MEQPKFEWLPDGRQTLSSLRAQAEWHKWCRMLQRRREWFARAIRAHEKKGAA